MFRVQTVKTNHHHLKLVLKVERTPPHPLQKKHSNVIKSQFNFGNSTARKLYKSLQNLLTKAKGYVLKLYQNEASLRLMNSRLPFFRDWLRKRVNVSDVRKH